MSKGLIGDEDRAKLDSVVKLYNITGCVMIVSCVPMQLLAIGLVLRGYTVTSIVVAASWFILLAPYLIYLGVKKGRIWAEIMAKARQKENDDEDPSSDRAPDD